MASAITNFNFRSDLDTFPTPAMVGAWPDKVLANRYMWYTFSDESEYKTNSLAVTKLLLIWTLSPLLLWWGPGLTRCWPIAKCGTPSLMRVSTKLTP